MNNPKRHALVCWLNKSNLGKRSPSSFNLAYESSKKSYECAHAQKKDDSQIYLELYLSYILKYPTKVGKLEKIIDLMTKRDHLQLTDLKN